MSTTINDDAILDARDMHQCKCGAPITKGLRCPDCRRESVNAQVKAIPTEITEARERPSTFITAEQARSIDNMMSSYTVFALIETQAKAGHTDLYVAYNRLAPETMELLGAGGYRVRLGGVANDQAVISWAEESNEA